MGPFKEKYTHYKMPRDQYVGQVLSRLNVNSPEFGVLPPYFEFAGAEWIEQEIKSAIDTMIVGGGRMCPQMIHLVNMAYASICCHHCCLDNKLHSRIRIQ